MRYLSVVALFLLLAVPVRAEVVRYNYGTDCPAGVDGKKETSCIVGDAAKTIAWQCLPMVLRFAAAIQPVDRVTTTERAFVFPAGVAVGDFVGLAFGLLGSYIQFGIDEAAVKNSVYRCFGYEYVSETTRALKKPITGKSEAP